MAHLAVAPFGQGAPGGEHGVGVGPRLVDGGATDLHDLHAVARLAHPVTDGRRLEHTVAGVHRDHLALVLVEDLHPSAVAVDHLELDVVVVHVVGDLATGRDEDVRGDVRATQT